jgi:hypothetical protein
LIPTAIGLAITSTAQAGNRPPPGARAALGGQRIKPQDYEDLTRHLAAITWKNLQVIAEQDPTRARLARVLEQNRAIQQMDVQGLRHVCTQLEAKYGVDNGREA